MNGGTNLAITIPCLRSYPVYKASLGMNDIQLKSRLLGVPVSIQDLFPNSSRGKFSSFLCFLQNTRRTTISIISATLQHSIHLSDKFSLCGSRSCFPIPSHFGQRSAIPNQYLVICMGVSRHNNFTCCACLSRDGKCFASNLAQRYWLNLRTRSSDSALSQDLLPLLGSAPKLY